MSQTEVQDISDNVTKVDVVQNASGLSPAVAQLDGAPVDGAPASAAEAFDAGSTNGAARHNDDTDALMHDEAADKKDLGSANDSLNSEGTLEIDQRRARQLLDRAMLLSERGDLAGAILASRQAVSLAPHEASGHSMLGLLQERAGDLEKAISSYEKVLQLAPNSSLERDSLERLKATLESENSSVVFHFDDNELFEEPEAIKAPVGGVPGVASTAKPVPATAAIKNVSPASSTIASRTVTPLAAAPAVQSPASAVAMANSPDAVKPLDKLLLDVAPPPRSLPGRSDLLPLTMPTTAKRASLSLLMRQPSFYFRGAPVVAATTLGLLFMGWAEGVSRNKFWEETPPGTATSTVTGVASKNETPAGAPPQGNMGTTVKPPQAATTVGSGGIFGSGSPAAPPPAAGTTGTTTTTPGRPSGSAPPSSSASAPVGSIPPSSTQQLPPMIPRPDSGGSRGGGTSRGSDGGSGTLNSLPAFPPVRQPREVVRPSEPSAPQNGASAGSTNGNAGSGSGNSPQGGMFNPSTSPRGYIRIDPVRPINPVTPVARPGNEARAAENAASRAAATGRTNDVVPSLNRSIERQATAYVYQRRAMAFMEQKDFSRAADDFQSAIAAYEDQIRRGQNVDDARNGIQTCRSGLKAVLDMMGR